MRNKIKFTDYQKKNIPIPKGKTTYRQWQNANPEQMEEAGMRKVKGRWV